MERRSFCPRRSAWRQNEVRLRALKLDRSVDFWKFDHQVIKSTGPLKGAPGGTTLEVRFADGVWYSSRLFERISGTDSLIWKMLLEDGETRDDILFTSPGSKVRFDASAYGVRVEVRLGGK